MSLLETVLFGCLSLGGLVLGFVSLYRKHCYTTLICSMISLVSIGISCYFWVLTLLDSGKPVVLLGFERYPVVPFVVAALIIGASSCAILSMQVALSDHLPMQAKRATRIVIFCLILVLVVIVIAHMQYNSIIGTWTGDGTMDVKGTDFPLDGSTKLTFSLDGTVTVEWGGYDHATYQYGTTNDTITVNDGSLAHGILYDVEGDSLLFGSGGQFGVFYR